MAAKYLFDSNTFFQSKNREYRFEFASEFWDWIITAHKNQMIYSVQKVLDEINRGANTCPAKAWAANLPGGFFLPDTKDAAVMKNYATVMQWGTAQTHYTTKAKTDFADPKDADAFLIASAMGNGMIICTHETSEPACKRRIPLPDAAATFGVKTVHIFDVLTAHAVSGWRTHLAASAMLRPWLRWPRRIQAGHGAALQPTSSHVPASRIATKRRRPLDILWAGDRSYSGTISLLQAIPEGMSGS